jgi:hypothetical protein
MPYCPCFFCNNMNCRLYSGVLWLPYPSPPKTKPDPKPWPMDTWQALLLCPDCKQFRIHTKADILWRARTDEDYAGYLQHTTWFCVKFECAASGCGTPAELHVEMDAGTPIRAVDNMLRSGGVDGTLPCGHWFLPPDRTKCRIEVESNQQQIPSYFH